MLDNMVFPFPAHHFLFKVFDKLLQRYIEADLINYNTREWNERYNPKKLEQFEEPFAVLTLQKLEAGFVVCLVPLFLSIFVFCFEWLVVAMNLTVFLLIFGNFFEVKKAEQKIRCDLIKVLIANIKANKERNKKMLTELVPKPSFQSLEEQFPTSNINILGSHRSIILPARLSSAWIFFVKKRIESRWFKIKGKFKFFVLN